MFYTLKNTTKTNSLIFNQIFVLLVIGSLFSNIQAQCLPGYNFYKQITIQSSKVAADQTDFPVLIQHTDLDLRHTTSTGDVENINGYDITFTAADKITVLDHQIESYDPTTGKITMWLKIPFLSGTVDTDVYMYYGNSAIATDPSTTSVWDANHRAVYHFESIATMGDDATSNAVNLANNGVDNFVGVADDGANFELGDNLEGAVGGGANITANLTISTWVNLHSLQGSVYDNVLVVNGAAGETMGTNYAYYLSIDPDWKLRIFWEYDSGTNAVYTSTAPITPSIGGWTQLTVTRKISNEKLA